MFWYADRRSSVTVLTSSLPAGRSKHGDQQLWKPCCQLLKVLYPGGRYGTSYRLLPQRDSDITSRLRRRTAYPIPRTKTKKYRSLFTLPWLNITNLNALYWYTVYDDLYAMWCELDWFDTKDLNVPFTDFYIDILCLCVLLYLAL